MRGWRQTTGYIAVLYIIDSHQNEKKKQSDVT